MGVANAGAALIVTATMAADISDFLNIILFLGNEYNNPFIGLLACMKDAADLLKELPVREDEMTYHKLCSITVHRKE